jgi:hypothetical protein
VIAKFGRGRRNSSKCLARGCKGGLAGEVRPCDESLFEFMEMRRESRWEGRETHWEGGRETGYLQELSQARHTGHAMLGKYRNLRVDKTKAWGEFWQAQVMSMQWSQFSGPLIADGLVPKVPKTNALTEMRTPRPHIIYMAFMRTRFPIS